MEMLLVRERASSVGRDRDLDWEYEHMRECARVARVLAAHRRLDPELAACAATVQNIGRVLKGRSDSHAEAGYLPAKQLFTSLRCFTAKEVEILATAVRNHSRKERIDGPMDELTKDADIYVRYLKGSEISRPYDVRRLKAVQADLLKPVKK
jgi:uncharacterized protein